MQNKPLVSILLLSMNHEAFIEQCISSLATQTYRNLEIIYVDNASSDGTFEKGKALLQQSGLPHQCFSNKESKNISSNLNFLYDQSSGDIISPLSTDDWFEPTNIEKKVNFFLSNPDVGAVFSNGWIYLDDLKQTILNDVSSFRRGYIFKEVLTQADCIFYVGVMYRRAIIDQVGKWDDRLQIEDTDMYIRIGCVAKIDFLEEPLVYYRRTSTSVSKNKKFMLAGFRQYYEKYKDVNWINMKHWLAERYRRMAANDIDNANMQQARAFLAEAIRLHPLALPNYRTLLYFIRQSFKRSQI